MSSAPRRRATGAAAAKRPVASTDRQNRQAYVSTIGTTNLRIKLSKKKQEEMHVPESVESVMT